MTPDNPKRVLVVGAGGFIGGFIVAEALDRGFEVWAGVRATTSRRYLSDPRLHFVELDFDGGGDALASALRDALPQGCRWDYIVYNLGATKCTNFADFNRINFSYLREFIEALRESEMTPERLLYMSSLSAIGPGDEKHYTPLTSRAIPQPNTRYGLSKIKAETLLDTAPDIPWTIFRPTGVYGPHERDYLMMIESIDRGFDFGVGFRRQMLTFIYVKDLAAAIFDAIDRPATLRRKYIISEPRSYTQGEFRKLVARALGKKLVIPVRLPMWMAYVASWAAEKWGVARMKPSTLNRDKYKIMRQRNWNCDISDAIADFGFTPRYTLSEGLEETVRCYKAEKEAAAAAKTKH